MRILFKINFLKGRELSLALFWKFTLALVSIVFFFGIINLSLMKYSLYDLFETELIKHGRITGMSIADRCVVPITYNDLGTLDRLVSDQKRIDHSLAYIFVVYKGGKILAHSFAHSVPSELLNLYKNKFSNTIQTLEIMKADRSDILIRDLSIPILKGNLGVVRIGLYEDAYLNSTKRTTRIFMLMVLAFLFLGLLGAFFFSFIITTPLNKISSIARQIEIGSLDIQEENFEAKFKDFSLVKWKNIFGIQDEIDTLIRSFGEMVSRLKSTYDELQKVQISLFQSEKMASLGTLSAGIAHEINNPIAGMQNCVKRLKSKPENLKQNILYLEMIEEALKKTEFVVKGLLNFSRKHQLQFRAVKVCSIIDNVLLLTKYKLEKAKIGIVKHYNDCDSFISASTNHIEQVILNIVLNSIDAVNEKKFNNKFFLGEIKFIVEEEENYISMQIADNGIGVPEESLNDIFNPFFTMKKVSQGTGLGLAVSYTIVEQHGGTLFAKLNKEGGLTIYLKLLKYKN